jgi:hypothetical protein
MNLIFCCEEICHVNLLDPYFGWKRSIWCEELEACAKLVKDVRNLMKTSDNLKRVQVMTIRHVGAATVASLNHSCVWLACCKLVSLENIKKGTKMLDAYNENPLEYQDLHVMSGSTKSVHTKLTEEYLVQLQYLKKNGNKVSRMDISKVLLDSSIKCGILFLHSCCWKIIMIYHDASHSCRFPTLPKLMVIQEAIVALV